MHRATRLWPTGCKQISCKLHYIKADYAKLVLGFRNKGAMQIKTSPWKILPALSAGLIVLLLLYGGYRALTTVQVIQIASGARGGGYYELGQKLEQILRADFEQQTLEAPVNFQHRDSYGPQENLRLLANREARTTEPCKLCLPQ